LGGAVSAHLRCWAFWKCPTTTAIINLGKKQGEQREKKKQGKKKKKYCDLDLGGGSGELGGGFAFFFWLHLRSD